MAFHVHRMPRLCPDNVIIGTMTPEQTQTFAAEMKSAGAVEIPGTSLDLGDWVAVNGQIGTVVHIGELTIRFSTGDYMPRTDAAKALLLPPDFLSRSREAAQRSQQRPSSPDQVFSAPAAPTSREAEQQSDSSSRDSAVQDALLNPFALPATG